MKEIVLVLVLGALLGSGAVIHGEPDHPGHRARSGKGPVISRASYRIPGVPVVRMDGERVDFAQEIDSGRPTVLNFMYTSCTAFCLMTTQVLSEFQQKLESERESVNLVSVSVDPEVDTPPRLTAYARRLGAQPGWQFFTATPEASIAIQKAFGVYRGDRTSHTPTAFFRLAPDKPWIRVDGLASADKLLEIYRNMLKEN